MQEQKLKQISMHTLYYISVSVNCPGTVKKTVQSQSNKALLNRH